jgi:hypothetical protein
MEKARLPVFKQGAGPLIFQIPENPRQYLSSSLKSS